MFRSCINDLYTTPRLPQPVWLHMMTYSTHKVALCDHFLREFMQVFEKYDTKSTKLYVTRQSFLADGKEFCLLQLTANV